MLYEAEVGLRHLAIEGASTDLASRINAVKTAFSDAPGGTFYVNEYRHVLVPVAGDPLTGSGSHYYCAGKATGDFTFEFEGQALTTKPVHPSGTVLKAGDPWMGPMPGIPYVLAAGGGDIYYETPALTDSDPPEIRPMSTRRVVLSKILGTKWGLQRATAPVSNIRGHQGGRFYVNEHGAIFTPVGAGDGNGIDYVYCGQIDSAAWFPEPTIA